MPATSSLTDCKTLVNAVTAAQGRVPDVLGHILSSATLLDRHSTVSDPAKALVDAAVAGELDEKRLSGLIDQAAHAQMVADFTGDVRQRLAPMLTAAFRTALKDGAADEILDSLRPVWDEAAEAIAVARSLFNAESGPDHILASGEPATITAWQSLDGHLLVIGKIAAVASQFGPRLGQFPLITEYSLADGFRLEDRALFATDGGLEVDSGVFRQPDRGHRTSPYFRLPLKLHSVESAQARYNAWANGQWERLHAGTDGKLDR